MNPARISVKPVTPAKAGVQADNAQEFRIPLFASTTAVLNLTLPSQ